MCRREAFRLALQRRAQLFSAYREFLPSQRMRFLSRRRCRQFLLKTPPVFQQSQQFRQMPLFFLPVFRASTFKYYFKFLFQSRVPLPFLFLPADGGLPLLSATVTLLLRPFRILSGRLRQSAGFQPARTALFRVGTCLPQPRQFLRQSRVSGGGQEGGVVFFPAPRQRFLLRRKGLQRFLTFGRLRLRGGQMFLSLSNPLCLRGNQDILLPRILQDGQTLRRFGMHTRGGCPGCSHAALPLLQFFAQSSQRQPLRSTGRFLLAQLFPAALRIVEMFQTLTRGRISFQQQGLRFQGDALPLKIVQLVFLQAHLVTAVPQRLPPADILLHLARHALQVRFRAQNFGKLPAADLFLPGSDQTQALDAFPQRLQLLPGPAAPFMHARGNPAVNFRTGNLFQNGGALVGGTLQKGRKISLRQQHGPREAGKVHPCQLLDLARHPLDGTFQHLVPAGQLMPLILQLSGGLFPGPALTPVTTELALAGCKKHFGKALSRLAGHDLVSALLHIGQPRRAPVQGKTHGVQNRCFSCPGRPDNGKQSLGLVVRMTQIYGPFPDKGIQIHEADGKNFHSVLRFESWSVSMRPSRRSRPAAVCRAQERRRAASSGQHIFFLQLAQHFRVRLPQSRAHVRRDLMRLHAQLKHGAFVKLRQIDALLDRKPRHLAGGALILDSQDLQPGAAHGLFHTTPEIAYYFLAIVHYFQPYGHIRHAQGRKPAGNGRPVAADLLNMLKNRDREKLHLRLPVAIQTDQTDALLLSGLAKAHRQRRAAVAALRHTAHFLGHVQMPQRRIAHPGRKNVGADMRQRTDVQLPHAVTFQNRAARGEEMPRHHHRKSPSQLIPDMLRMPGNGLVVTADSLQQPVYLVVGALPRADAAYFPIPQIGDGADNELGPPLLILQHKHLVFRAFPETDHMNVQRPQQGAGRFQKGRGIMIPGRNDHMTTA